VFGDVVIAHDLKEPHDGRAITERYGVEAVTNAVIRARDKPCCEGHKTAWSANPERKTIRGPVFTASPAAAPITAGVDELNDLAFEARRDRALNGGSGG